MKPILEIQGVSKKFILNHQGTPYLNFRDKFSHLFRRNSREEFWALKEISFQVNRGESMGIIGRNGAGKSTLLKILSRITPPTQGRVISRGRIASLLEVGTGFHQELTGRENVFMNGSILGMKRSEIKLKFDEIIGFSGTEKFLDTQLKHFSSGMQLRLAFAVAAHLEPEILIIDEVLAVGDSVFQKKCMSKMAEVSSQGRTIIFVSHNMQAVRAICGRAMIIQSGKVVAQGQTDSVVTQYLQEDHLESSNTYDLSTLKRAKWKQGLTFQKLNFDKNMYHTGEKLVINISLRSDGQKYKDLLFGVNMYDSLGNCLVHLSNIFLNRVDITHDESATYQFTVDSLNFKPGRYTMSLFVRANEEIQDWLDGVAMIEIEEGNIYGFENSQMIQGLVQPEFRFEQLYEQQN